MESFLETAGGAFYRRRDPAHPIGAMRLKRANTSHGAAATGAVRHAIRTQFSTYFF